MCNFLYQIPNSVLVSILTRCCLENMKGWNIFAQNYDSKLVKENMSKELRLSEKHTQVLKCVHFHRERIQDLEGGFGKMKDFHKVYGGMCFAKYKNQIQKTEIKWSYDTCGNDRILILFINHVVKFLNMGKLLLRF